MSIFTKLDQWIKKRATNSDFGAGPWANRPSANQELKNQMETDSKGPTFAPPPMPTPEQLKAWGAPDKTKTPPSDLI